MKALLINVLFIITCLTASSQVFNKNTRAKTTTQGSRNTNTTNSTSASRNVSNGPTVIQPVQARQTVTERRINGPLENQAGLSGKPEAKESPFVGGIRAADNAAQRFDTTSRNMNSTGLNSTGTVNIAGGNDTTFNVNTTNQNGVNTTSGAIDRSGQSQFGQTNWGRNNRNTVGESQWTIPPPITASFNKQFPDVTDATWSRNTTDTSSYSVRYKSGTNWVSSRYSAAGQQLDLRTEIPLVQAPRPVSVFLAKQPDTFKISSISRLQIQGRPEVYEIRTGTGKTIYINNDGMETGL